MNTPTPETDAATYGLRDEIGIKVEVVNSDFARKLELQRDEARLALVNRNSWAREVQQAAKSLEVENDQLRKVCDELANAHLGLDLGEASQAALESYNSLPHVMANGKQ